MIKSTDAELALLMSDLNRSAFHYCKNTHDADDIVQETMLTLLTEPKEIVSIRNFAFKVLKWRFLKRKDRAGSSKRRETSYYYTSEKSSVNSFYTKETESEISVRSEKASKLFNRLSADQKVIMYKKANGIPIGGNRRQTHDNYVRAKNILRDVDELSKLEFRTIPGYEGLYEISKCGKIRSIKLNKFMIAGKNVTFQKNGVRAKMRRTRAYGLAWVDNPNNYKYFANGVWYDNNNPNGLNGR